MLLISQKSTRASCRLIRGRKLRLILAWEVKLSKEAEKQLSSLDNSIRKKLLPSLIGYRYIQARVPSVKLSKVLYPAYGDTL